MRWRHLPGRRKLPSCRRTNPGTRVRKRGSRLSVRFGCNLATKNLNLWDIERKQQGGDEAEGGHLPGRRKLPSC